MEPNTDYTFKARVQCLKNTFKFNITQNGTRLEQITVPASDSIETVSVDFSTPDEEITLAELRLFGGSAPAEIYALSLCKR